MGKGLVITAMSGGVDSSVTALLLKREGYEVVGVTLRLYDADPQDSPRFQGCCSLDDVEDARLVCHALGIRHYVFDVREEFRRWVIDYFLQEYRRGRTPHPCIACNEAIKFNFLVRRARMMGADFVATGHHARILRDEAGRFHLLKGLDPLKDQSYVLYGMGQRELAGTLFPVGWFTKAEIRRMAEEAGFPNARKPDSQEICFIPSGDYRRFIARRFRPTPGPIVDTSGRVLGRHPGYEFFTVGQRRGLGIASDRPLYVVDILPETATVVVGTAEELLRPALLAEAVNYVSEEPRRPLEVTVKIRYRSPEEPATLYPLGGKAVVVFRRPQRAITPGQAVVFYRGDEVVGGGRIERSLTGEQVGALLTEEEPVQV